MTQPKILVVEDEAIVARDIQQQLAERGYQALGHTPRAEEAVALTGELRPDLVLMDIHLAGKTDGIEAAQIIRERFAVPVIFLTAFVGEKILDRAKQAEPYGYIVKPFNEQELFTTIELALHKHRMEARLRQSYAEQAAILRTAMDGFWVVDAQGRLQEANDAACRMTGYTREELLNMSLPDLMPTQSAECVADTMAQIKQAGSGRFERQQRCKDGRIAEVEVSVNYLPDNGGRFFCFHRDITERKRMEAELRHLAAFPELNPNPVLEFASDGTLNYQNPAALGLARNLGASDLAEVLPTGTPAIVAACLSSGEPLLRLETGHRDRTISWSFYPQSAQGIVHCYAGDVSERKRALEALRESEEKLRQIMEHSTQLFYAHTPEDVLTYISPRSREFFDCEPDEARVRWTEFLTDHPANAEGFMLSRAAIQTGRRQRPYQLELRSRRGRTLWVEVCESPVVVAGRTVAMVGALTDITESKRAQDLLRLQTTALEAAANAIIITDREGRILWVNPAFTEFTGYEAGEAIGQNPRLLNSGQHDEVFYQGMLNTVHSGKVWHGELTNRRKDGSHYLEEMTITPVKDESGNITHFIAVKQDITQRKALEEQFRQAQKMDAFGQLAGGVAHDFNNILAVIMMQAGLIQSGDGRRVEAVSMAREIGQAAQRGADLTRQLLLFSRRQTMNARTLNLNNAVANLTKMLRRIVGEDIEMQIKPAASPLWVNADAGMLDQVLMNLVVNARDAMPDGGRLCIETLEAELGEAAAQQFPQGRPGVFVCLKVTDSGSGIASEHLARIFEPFFTTKAVGKGTGLGLATVFGIVQQHQGWIDVSSEVGQGSTFRIYLPRIRSGVEAKPARAADLTTHAGRETILLVEDEKPLRSLMSNALTRLGYRVVEAASGVEALEVWRQQGGEVQLLITDLVMPGGVNGKELVQQLCRERPDLKVIYVSGYSSEVVGTDLLLEEGVNFLSKPFVLSKLAETLRRRLDSRDDS